MKILLAFAAGVALSSLVFALLDRPATTPPPAKGNGTTPRSSAFAGPDRDIPSSSQASTTADAAPADRSSEEVACGADFPDELTRFAMRNDRGEREAIDLLRSWSDEELSAVEEHAEAMVACSQEVRKEQEVERIMDVVAGELLRRERIASWDDAPPPEQPILLPPEFNRHLESANVRRDHENLQREPVDPTWALPMERNLRAFISGQSELLGKYGYPTITCRSSRCEVTFVAYGLDTAARAAELGNPDMSPEIVLGSDFFYAARSLGEEPWVLDQLYPATVSPSIRTQAGITTVFWHLWRDRE